MKGLKILIIAKSTALRWFKSWCKEISLFFPEMEVLRDWIYPVSQYCTAIWGNYHSFFHSGSVLNLYTVSVNTTQLFGVISNTTPLWKKEWQYTASSRNELENTPLLGLRDCPRASGCKLPQGAYFPIHPSSQQRINTIFSWPPMSSSTRILILSQL